MRPWRQEAAMAAFAFAAASAIPFLSPEAQARFGAAAGGAPPLLLIAVAAVAGTGAVHLLRTGGFFAARGGGGIVRAAVVGAAFALPGVFGDLAAPWPEGLNQPWPEAWLYYPAMAVVAAALLHAVPLALAHLATGRPWPAIALAATVEPALQWVWSAGQPDWQRALTAGVLYLFGIAGMELFRRHGVAALIVFRAAHYLVWHVLWGAARLALPLAGP